MVANTAPACLLSACATISASVMRGKCTLVIGLCLFVVTVLFLRPHVSAATSTWNGTSIYGDWSSGSDWSGGVPNDSTATATFTDYINAPDEVRLNVDGNYSVGSLLFSYGAAPSDVLLQCSAPDSLSIYNSIISTSSTAPAITCPVVLMDNVTISGTSETLLYRTISGNGGLTINISPGARVYTIDSATYTGPTYITSGTLQAGYDNTWSPYSDYILADSADALLQIGGPVPEQIGSLTGGAASTVDLWGGTLTVGNSNNTTFAGTIIDGSGGPSNLVKVGSSSLTLSGANTYSGTTTVSAGKLIVNGSLASSGVTVDAGGTLRGSGTLPAVTLHGIAAPGNSIGTLNGTDFTFASGSTLENELNPAGQTDLVNASGNITINPGSTLKIIPATGSYTAGQTYTILQAPNITGSFSSVEDTSGTLNYEVKYYADHVDIVIKAAASVTSADSSTLADTGTSVAPVLALAAGLLFVGSALGYWQYRQPNV